MGSGSGPPHRTEEKTKAGTGSFWFPSIFPSLVASLVQGYPLLFPNIAGAKTNEKSLDIGGPYSKQSSMPRGIQEAKTFYRLPTMIALVGAENLIAAKLQSQLAAFAKETQIAQSTISEPMFEFGTATINSTPLLSELTSGAIQSYTVEPYVPSAPSLPPSPRPKTMSPTIQNAINVTLSAETAEEDLRELERKISRILSEQIGRYYGSSKF
jgi:hypothetical protein